MYKLLSVGLLFTLPALAAEEKLIDDTAYAIPIDQTVRERVFLGCVDAIKGQTVKDFTELDDAIKQCEKSATQIAFRGQHATVDGKWYVTARPVEENKQ